MEEAVNTEPCKTEVAGNQRFREEIPEIVDQLVGSCNNGDCFDHVGPEPISSKKSIIELIDRAKQILFPGYFSLTHVDTVNIKYFLGQELTAFFEAVSEQITLAIRHECLRHNLPCTECEQREPRLQGDGDPAGSGSSPSPVA